MEKLGKAKRRKVVVAWQVAEDDKAWQELTVPNEAAVGTPVAAETRTNNARWPWMTALSVALLLVLMGAYLRPETQADEAELEPVLVEVVDSAQSSVTAGSDATLLSTFNPGADLDWQQQMPIESAIGQELRCDDTQADGGHTIRFRNGYILP